MTRVAPAYFKNVAQEAHIQWDLLESQPRLAAPWRQLFRQVQSPRHVLSELLQNADDAGARRVRAWLSDGLFCFEHDGDDFNEENLTSLCSFGFSNKRHLHTIGFRGLGFKSTFSLGHGSRYVRRRWRLHLNKSGSQNQYGRTSHPKSSSHASRYLFRNQRFKTTFKICAAGSRVQCRCCSSRTFGRLDLQGQIITKEVLDNGPVPNSVWIKLDSGNSSNRVLLIESDEEPFPPEALQEIRSERGEQDFALPGCKVGIVVGMSGEPRLYVVLPSEVRPRLPFSFNAPFLQDPARTGIKDPITSPTNQWLLMRVGKLAASAMHLWLSNGALDLGERARAYQLLPEFNVESGALDRDCARAVITSFKNITNPRPELLTHQGTLAYRGECLDIPPELLEVWPPDQVRAIFNPTRSFVLAPQIQRNYRNRLVQWGWLEAFDTITLLRKLSEPPNPPRPATLERLVALWAYLEPLVRSGAFRLINFRGLRIVPVRDKGYLDSAESVTFVGERDRKLDERDWNFLLDRIQLADPAYVELIASTDGIAESDEKGAEAQRAATGLFSLLRLNERASLQQVIDTVR